MIRIVYWLIFLGALFLFACCLIGSIILVYYWMYKTEEKTNGEFSVNDDDAAIPMKYNVVSSINEDGGDDED